MELGSGPTMPFQRTAGEYVATVGRHYAVRRGLDAVGILNSGLQRVISEPDFSMPILGQECRRADLCLYAWKEGRDLYVQLAGWSALLGPVLELIHPARSLVKACLCASSDDYRILNSTMCESCSIIPKICTSALQLEGQSSGNFLLLGNVGNRL